MEGNIARLLLERFVAGQVSEEESAKVNRFVQTEAGRTALKQLFEARWEHAADGEIDAHRLAALEAQLRERLNLHSPAERRPVFRMGGGWRRLAPYAAALTLFVGVALSIWLFTGNTGNNPFDNLALQEKTVPNGRQSSIRLSDGTRVILGPGSRLHYPRVFAQNRRDIRLYGEGFFEVAHDKKRPFTVHTGDVRTQVLGTSFKIDAFNGEPLKVSVATGKVRVDRWKNGRPVEALAVLNPGQTVVYAEGTESVREFAIADLLQWKTGKAVFNGVRLNQLVRDLERWYDMRIVLEKEGLADESVTVMLDAEVPVRELLNTLTSILGCDYRIEENVITLY